MKQGQRSRATFKGGLGPALEFRLHPSLPLHPNPSRLAWGPGAGWPLFLADSEERLPEDSPAVWGPGGHLCPLPRGALPYILGTLANSVLPALSTTAVCPEFT